MSLPFELNKNHKAFTKYSWRKKGMKFTDEDFEMYIYPKYIYATHCDLCKNKFKNSRDRHLDHNHNTEEIRNIVCRICNNRKSDNKIRKDNSTGFKYISKAYHSKYNQGFIWVFKIKKKKIKSSINLDYLIKFRDDWLKENNYET